MTQTIPGECVDTLTALDTWEAVRTVRVVREFRDEPLPDELLLRILNAGRRAGSSKNQQR